MLVVRVEVPGEIFVARSISFNAIAIRTRWSAVVVAAQSPIIEPGRSKTGNQVVVLSNVGLNAITEVAALFFSIASTLVIAIRAGSVVCGASRQIVAQGLPGSRNKAASEVSASNGISTPAAFSCARICETSSKAMGKPTFRVLKLPTLIPVSEVWIPPFASGETTCTSINLFGSPLTTTAGTHSQVIPLF